MQVKPRLSCLGCSCTDDRACAGGCSWSQPGICSRCAPHTDKLLVGSKRAYEMVRARAIGAILLGRKNFSVMSLALLSFLDDEKEAAEHRARLSEGALLKPFTSVRMGKGYWTYSLVYRPPKREPGIKVTMTWRLSIGRA